MPTIDQMLTDIIRRHEEATSKQDMKGLDAVLFDYNHLLNQNYDNPSILFSVATCYLQMGWHGIAINLFKYILESWPDCRDTPQVWNNLGTAYKGEHIDAEAEKAWNKAVEVTVDNDDLKGDYYSNLATIHINNGDPEVGLELITKSIELKPNSPKAHWNRSLIELELGDYENGFKDYEVGIVTKDRLDKWPDIEYYNGEDLKGMTVLVYGEQGVGDEIMFASALPELIDAVGLQGHVIYECHDRLESLMKRTFKQYSNVVIQPTRKEKEEKCTWINKETIDRRMAIGSLFRWFGVKKRAPYLIPKPELVDHYKHKLAEIGDGLKVGIGYAGGHKKTHAHTRSFKLATLSPILGVEGCEFVSLQYTEEATAKFSNHLLNTGINVHHWPDTLYRSSEKGFNFDHTVALIAALDVCVLPNTTAVHVCGAVGTKCYSLTPEACAWRYRGEDSHMTMYENHVTLFREQDGSFSNQVNKIATAVQMKITGGLEPLRAQSS